MRTRSWNSLLPSNVDFEPESSKVDCMRFIPAVSLLRSGKGKAPSSTYSSWNISNVVSLVELYMRGCFRINQIYLTYYGAHKLKYTVYEFM
jgi:hypothetical protein